MIRHTVAFRLHHAPGSPEEADFLAAARALADIPGVEAYEQLRQTSAKNGFTFGFSMEFADQAAIRAGRRRPARAGARGTWWGSPTPGGGCTGLQVADSPLERGLCERGRQISGPSRRDAQRVQTYGVVVVIARRPERSRIGRDMSVQSEWISRMPRATAERARAATSAR
jgi:hypothetical protein